MILHGGSAEIKNGMAALPQMRGGDGILCDRRYCNGAGAEAVGKAEGENGRKANMIPLAFQLGDNDFE